MVVEAFFTVASKSIFNMEVMNHSRVELGLKDKKVSKEYNGFTHFVIRNTHKCYEAAAKLSVGDIVFIVLDFQFHNGRIAKHRVVEITKYVPEIVKVEAPAEVKRKLIMR